MTADASFNQIDVVKLQQALRTAGRGSAPDLSGTRYEHLRVLMEDDELWPLFVSLCSRLARADVPEGVVPDG